MARAARNLAEVLNHHGQLALFPPRQGGRPAAMPVHPRSAVQRGATPLDLVLRGPDKYRILDLKRRRAQIRARRELDLVR
jgi:hypothetical protein